MRKKIKNLCKDELWGMGERGTNKMRNVKPGMIYIVRFANIEGISGVRFAHCKDSSGKESKGAKGAK